MSAHAVFATFPEPQAPREPNVRAIVLFALFAVEILAISLARLPENLRFDGWAFCDQGGNLTLQYLTAKGLRPAVDFSYTYGLLPALVGRIWFNFFGATPCSYQSAMVLANLVCVLAFARIVSYLKVGKIGLALAFIALGYAYQASYVNFAHAIEAVLLSLALSAQTRGSLATALAYCAAATFAKPTMALFYGLLLIILIVIGKPTIRTTRYLVEALLPALVVMLALGTILACIYGARAFFWTIIPTEGMANYRALNFGFMRVGREFWDPHNLPWIYYLIHPAGLWILSTAFLVSSAAASVWKFMQRGHFDRRSEIILTCALLHIAFIAFFFGNQFSWIYYSYVLVVGTCIAIDAGALPQRVGFALCAIALISWALTFHWLYGWWTTTGPDQITAGLWASEEERNEWKRVLNSRDNGPVVMLSKMDTTGLLFPQFEPPTSMFLLEGLTAVPDVRRKLDQIAGAHLVVVPLTIPACTGLPPGSEFKNALDNFTLSWEGKHFEVFERKHLP
jgi:hypothetical protein